MLLGIRKSNQTYKNRKPGQYQMPKDIDSRLVDFYTFGGAVCEVLQIPDWAEIFRTYCKEQDDESLSGNPIGLGIIELMKDLKLTWKAWRLI